MATKRVTKETSEALATVDTVEQHILVIRRQKVMIDADLARIYNVTTRRLNEQVKRNRQRFPEDFMFQLTMEEAKTLLASRSQIATLKRGQNIKYAPYSFTEHGAVMLASVLNSPVAIEASIQVVRAFVRLRTILAVHQEFAQKLEALERGMKSIMNVSKAYSQPFANYLNRRQNRTGK